MCGIRKLTKVPATAKNQMCQSGAKGNACPFGCRGEEIAVMVVVAAVGGRATEGEQKSCSQASAVFEVGCVWLLVGGAPVKTLGERATELGTFD